MTSEAPQCQVSFDGQLLGGLGRTSIRHDSQRFAAIHQGSHHRLVDAFVWAGELGLFLCRDFHGAPPAGQ